ncbi:MAG: MotA/TolQ/ExbB proton channel family protein [Pseudomonadales bacterium]|nr:MotA/TolQ/ExbB proton channel family protein [Pseudomonadales bacterium]
MTTYSMSRRLLSVWGMLIAHCLAASVQAADLSAISQDIIQNIESSQKALSQAERDIAAQRQAIAEKLNRAQNAVAGLRAQVVAARRLSDEQTLGLNQLEERLQEWRQQSQFQTRLLSGFADLTRGPGDIPVGNDEELPAGLQWLDHYLNQQQDLQTGWQAKDIVMPDGQVMPAQSLRLGPLEWFWQPEQSQGGLLQSEAGLTKVALLFTDNARAGLERLYQTRQGDITFDPTLSRALLLAEEQETLLQHLEKGGIWAIPILLFAVFASTVSVIKALMLWRLPRLLPALPERLEALLREDVRDFTSLRQQLAGAQAELLAISLQRQTPEQRDERLFACLLRYKRQLESWLGAIAVTAAVAPLLGLLGTVSGMISTFKLMTLFGAGDPSVVSAGISEALVTTELGLVVAIPALLAHALMSRKVKSHFSELETDAIGLSQLDLPEATA